LRLRLPPNEHAAVARDDAHAFDIGLILLCGGLLLGRRKAGKTEE
jgi:hypothetical protein